MLINGLIQKKLVTLIECNRLWLCYPLKWQFSQIFIKCSSWKIMPYELYHYTCLFTSACITKCCNAAGLSHSLVICNQIFFDCIVHVKNDFNRTALLTCLHLFICHECSGNVMCYGLFSLSICSFMQHMLQHRFLLISFVFI